jgi:hypothetical protein
MTQARAVHEGTEHFHRKMSQISKAHRHPKATLIPPATPKKPIPQSKPKKTQTHPQTTPKPPQRETPRQDHQMPTPLTSSLTSRTARATHGSSRISHQRRADQRPQKPPTRAKASKPNYQRTCKRRKPPYREKKAHRPNHPGENQNRTT